MAYDIRTGGEAFTPAGNNGGRSQPGLPATAPAPAKKTARQPTAEEKAAALITANQNDQKATWDPASESYTFVALDSGEQIQRNAEKEAHPEWFTADGSTPEPANTAPVENADMIQGALDRLQNPVTNPALERKPINTGDVATADPGAVAITRGRTPRSTQAAPPMTGLDFAPQAPGKADALKEAFGDDGGTGGGPGAEAPEVNRARIDEILGGLSGYQDKIADLAGDNTGLSVAEAQLKKATDLANLQAGIDTEASQRAALGQARSSRSRNDRGLLERQAVGEAAFVGQEAARTASLRQAEQQGNLAELRAQEADYDRRFRLEALGKAADLGLNRSALEVDISKTNLDSATNWINQQFGQLGIDKQINQEQAQSMLGYTRDMAAIQLQYDQLSSQEQQQADALLMQKYGIDQQTAVALKGIKEGGKFKWDQLLAGIAGGVGTALTGGIANATGIT